MKYLPFIILLLAFLIPSQSNAQQIYTYTFGSQATNLAASTTYYIGSPFTTILSTSVFGTRRSFITKTGTITHFNYRSGAFTSPSSGENQTLYLRINGNSTTTLTTTHKTDTTTYGFSTDLDIPVNAGDYYEVILKTGSYATTPVNFSATGNLYVTVGTSTPSISSTTISVDLSSQTLFFAFMIFFISMILPIYLFRK